MDENLRAKTDKDDGSGRSSINDSRRSSTIASGEGPGGQNNDKQM
ncbi:MAG: hypothetical protein R2827_15515 [Bdellovibrionales bacterium]